MMSVLSRIHSDMRPILPGAGGRQTPCSISYRAVNNRFIMAVSFSKTTAYDLGFNVADHKVGNYAEIGFSESTGTLVVVNVNDTTLPTSDAVRWKGQLRQGTVVFMFRPTWLEGYRVAHPAERCEFKIMSEIVEGRRVKFIEIDVPDWAAPKRGMGVAHSPADANTKPRAKVTTRLLDTQPHVRPGPAMGGQ
jgi:hypothetical protein